MKCPYCGRNVTPEHSGNCPKCKAVISTKVISTEVKRIENKKTELNKEENE